MSETTMMLMTLTPDECLDSLTYEERMAIYEAHKQAAQRLIDRSKAYLKKRRWTPYIPMEDGVPF